MINPTIERPETSPHVQEVLRAAEAELTGLLRQRADLMRRIGTIKQTMSGLANLFGDSILPPDLRETLEGRISDRRKGFTRACRQVLMQSPTPLAAKQGCEELRRRFPEVANRHKELVASVTTVFHRLASYGEARSFTDAKGIRVWEWIAEPPTSGPENLLDLQARMQRQPPQPA